MKEKIVVFILLLCAGFASHVKSQNMEYDDMLEKITWGLVAFIAVVSIVASFASKSQNTTVDITDQIENVASEPAFPSTPIQANPDEE